MANSNKDLTVGKPGRVLAAFCLPLVASVIFQQLYNIADSLIAGKCIGELALAAVGNSYEITLIYIAFAMGCNIGCSVVVSRYFGARNYSDVKTTVYTMLLTGSVLCALLMGAGFLFSGMLLGAIQTPAEILEDSKLYLDVYILGLPFLFFYNIATGIFSALGDSKTPFCFLACSSTANILMDFIFVKYLNMGVAGVAWATFICQGISCVLAIIVVFGHLAQLKVKDKPVLFKWDVFKQLVIVSVPSILQQSFVSVGNIFIQGMINGYGAPVIAGYTASIKLNNMIISAFATLGNGISNFTSQNFGAGKNDRISQGFKEGLRIAWVIALPIALVYFFFGKYLLYLFIDNPTGDAMDTGMLILRILAPFYFVVSLKLVSDGVLRGASKMMEFMFGTFTDLLLRVALAAVFSMGLGSLGIWCAWPVGWIVSTAISVFFYHRFVCHLQE